MDTAAIRSDYVGLLIHSQSEIAPEKARELVCSALSSSGLRTWGAMELDIFPGDGCCLILARPVKGVRAAVADYAVPFLRGF